MNKYKFKKILENHSLYYLYNFAPYETCKNHDYVKGWIAGVYNIANKTGVKPYNNDLINKLIYNFSYINDLSELLSESYQEGENIFSRYVDEKMYLKGYIDKKLYLKGYNDIHDYIILKVKEEK